MQRTKHKRCIALVDAFAELFDRGGEGVAMNDVANWAAEHYLTPIPRHNDDRTLQDDWDLRLDQLIAKLRTPA